MAAGSTRPRHPRCARHWRRDDVDRTGRRQGARAGHARPNEGSACRDAILGDGGRTASRAEGLGVTTELIERAKRGDHAAFDTLATAAYHRLYGVALRILRDPYAAEDAVQDALVRAWRDWRAARSGPVRRLAASPARPRLRGPGTTGEAAPGGGRRHRHRPGRAVGQIALADRDALQRAFLELSVEHRSVLVLVHYVGMPAVDVAALLGLPAGTVYSRLPLRNPPDAQHPRAAVTAPDQLGARPMNDWNERAISAWLAEGPERGPAEGLQRALATTRSVRQRPPWLATEAWPPLTVAGLPQRSLLIALAGILLVVSMLGLMIAGGAPRAIPGTGDRGRRQWCDRLLGGRHDLPHGRRRRRRPRPRWGRAPGPFSDVLTRRHAFRILVHCRAQGLRHALGRRRRRPQRPPDQR